MPDAALLDFITARAGCAQVLTDPQDYAPGGVAGLLGLGLASPKSGLGGELTLTLYPGVVRAVPYPLLATELRVALAYDLANGPRVDVPLRLGAGGRALLINEKTKLQGYRLEDQLGLEGTTTDATLFGGTGVRFHLSGTAHLRVDLDAAAHFGDLPSWLGQHTFWEFTPSVSLELRAKPVLDNDGDRLPNEQDGCPTVAEDLDGFADQDGCPEADNDGDGIPDHADACDLDAEDVDRFQDADGCPEPNNDLDEFPDSLDACPDQRESANGWRDGDGCSDVLPDSLLDIDLLVVELHSDPAAWPKQLEAEAARVTTALTAEPDARVMVVLRGLTTPAMTPMVQAFTANGLLPRVGFIREDGGWPLTRPEPAVWQAHDRPLLVFAVVDPVDAQGKPVPFRP